MEQDVSEKYQRTYRRGTERSTDKVTLL